ncbi:MAG TPA: hypothetical protein VFV08_12260 [Puia sp.]|nr:hypothetical protein [Puia sp.]
MSIQTSNNPLPIMFNNNDELEFLLSNIKSDDNVLEYGAGGSTLEICKIARRVVSIEDNATWFHKVFALAPCNLSIYHVPKNEEEAPGEDGSYLQYKNYVDFPGKLNMKFNVVFIDGRARAAAAHKVLEWLSPGGIILIHDYRHPNPAYRRKDLEVIEDWLDYRGGAFALHKLVPKNPVNT